MNKITFLNGTLGFHDDGHKKYFQKLNSEGKYVMLIDNLFAQPRKMRQLVKYDTWVLGTTGFETEKLYKLFEAFSKLNYVPSVVIFAPDEDAFVPLAYSLKGKTEFYRLDYLDMTLTNLEYLNQS